MKISEDEAFFFEILTDFGYDVKVNSRQVTITNDKGFRVDLDKKGLETFIPIVMDGIEVKHF